MCVYPMPINLGSHVDAQQIPFEVDLSMTVILLIENPRKASIRLQIY